jgi:hypothetical protein
MSLRAFARVVLISFGVLMVAILILIGCVERQHPASRAHPDRSAPAAYTQP